MQRLILKWRGLWTSAGKVVPLLAFYLFSCCLQGGGIRDSPIISEPALKDLALKLAPKVVVFSEIWKLDPNAIFFGGTSRDFIYWILKKLRSAHSKEELDARTQELLKLDVIDIREIVGSESDIDVITNANLLIDGTAYGVRKIDRINRDRLDLNTETGRNEIDQGYIPIEKIQLSQKMIGSPPYFGDGIQEILSGQLTVHFSSDDTFWQSHYAKQFLNHPVMLAVRYLRLRAQHWFNMMGDGRPDLHELLNFDPGTKAKIKNIFQQAIADPKFEKVLRSLQGKKWLSASILKSFRAYTNPTAAYELFKALGFKELQSAYPEMESINQFLFLRYDDPEEIKRNFASFEVSPENIYSPVGALLPDFKIAHGTRTDEAFRGIIFQNIMPSLSGTAGSGLYAVDLNNLEFAERWGGKKENTIIFDIDPDAKIVDIIVGPGADLFDRWSQIHGRDHDAFAKAFGIDILRYPYSPNAYVVKNSRVLVGRVGLHRKLMTLSQAVEMARSIKDFDGFCELSRLLVFNGFSDIEMKNILASMPSGLFGGEFFDSCLNDERIDFRFFRFLFLDERIENWARHNLQRIDSVHEFNLLIKKLKMKYGLTDYIMGIKILAPYFKDKHIDMIFSDLSKNSELSIDPGIMLIDGSIRYRESVLHRISKDVSEGSLLSCLWAVFRMPQWAPYWEMLGNQFIQMDRKIDWFINSLLRHSSIGPQTKIHWVDQIVLGGKYDQEIFKVILSLVSGFRSCLTKSQLESQIKSWISQLLNRGNIDLEFLGWDFKRSIFDLAWTENENLSVIDNWLMKIIGRIKADPSRYKFLHFESFYFGINFNDWPYKESDSRVILTYKYIKEFLTIPQLKEMNWANSLMEMMKLSRFVSDESIQFAIDMMNSVRPEWMLQSYSFQYLQPLAKKSLKIQKFFASLLPVLGASELYVVLKLFNSFEPTNDDEIFSFVSGVSKIRDQSEDLILQQIIFYVRHGLVSNELRKGTLDLLAFMLGDQRSKNDLPSDATLLSDYLNDLVALISKFLVKLSEKERSSSLREFEYQFYWQVAVDAIPELKTLKKSKPASTTIDQPRDSLHGSISADHVSPSVPTGHLEDLVSELIKGQARIEAIDREIDKTCLKMLALLRKKKHLSGE